ncbi:MAG: hypothetical protein BGP23_00335 [Lysobacterales bacterium 66-474]|nr:MAG: hypothetical protein ABT18_11460 [Rhodanobacter sp. SCN 66-43]OJY85428.1 MAG: hypothetical protein BGP23_00335 [Xanthomonadales bacterium 66-474]
MTGVRPALLPNVQRVVTVGPCSDDLVDPVRTAATSAPDSGRPRCFDGSTNPRGCAGGSPTAGA